MEILQLAVMGIFNLAFFWLGYQARPREGVPRKTRQERTRVETILRNIDNYDGTACGQEDVPRR